MARIHPSKTFAEYLDLAQCTSTHGFHTDHYVPLQRTGDKALDKKAMQDLESTYALDDINVVLDSDEPTFITRDSYVAQLEAIKKSISERTIYDIDNDLKIEKNKDKILSLFKELKTRLELSKHYKEIIELMVIIYTHKHGRPLYEGKPYNYNPSKFWGIKIDNKKPEFSVIHSMQYYFDEFPHMEKQWTKSLKTRCRRIINEKLGPYRITGLIQFLRNKHVEESVSMLDEYRKPEVDNEEEYSYPIPLSTKDFPIIDIDDDEVPF